MADTTVSIRVDEDIKRRFEKFCSDVGINMSVAVNMFIRASLKDQKIPFSIEAPKPAKGLALLREMRAEAEERGFLTDEEINAEINAARDSIKARGNI
ncbi:MAG: type II toxin-antitoxin system RelB/DinJ family antitoxin [Clostridiales bacterium]|jgi:DNA-damage-inducible protein J|nr:type II toxin-antitoxin system RelB/DinJ family antitoxin [Clostridiales bacterium]MDR2712465.1 type II toxin-antitoxin system RelB/DinJ family antitoxin [Clostridiales bacterium]